MTPLEEIAIAPPVEPSGALDGGGTPIVGQVAAYPLNATADEPRYHRWLVERGEQPLPPSMPATPARPRAATTAQHRAGGRRVLRRLGRGRTAMAEPLFSVVVPCYRPPRFAFDRCIASVLAQDFADWQLLICDDASGDASFTRHLREIARCDRRISVRERSQNGGISAATNDAIALGDGAYLVFLDHDDELHPRALSDMAGAIAEHPGATLLYSDEDKVDEAGRRHMPSFKPDWSPDLLLSNAYMCHLLVVRRDVAATVGGVRSEFDGAQDYDLMLRVSELSEATGGAIVHVPEVLYHWRVLSGSAAGDPSAKPWAFDAGRRALVDAARRRGIEAEVMSHPDIPGSYHFRRAAKAEHLVSAVIPFRDEPALLAACYRSFVERPGRQEFELLLVDNDSSLPETHAVVEELRRDHRVRVVQAPGPFDWVAINNDAATKARGDLLLFLNNDVEARSPGWLAEMVAHAERPDVGAVGARLLYPDGTIQNAGVAAGLCFGAVHLLQGSKGSDPGYLSIAAITRNVTAVTGACMLTRRDVFEEMGGFDASLPVAFNDIDYCLRLRERHLLVVYTPLAELVHHESKSRGHADDTAELAYLRHRWQETMLRCDPYYNPNLGRFDCHCRLPTEEDEANWKIFRSLLGVS